MSVSGAFAVDGPSPELPFMSSFLTGKEVLGRPLPPADIRRRFRELRWEPTFKSLAVMASKLAREGILGRSQFQWMSELVNVRSPDPGYAIVDARVRPHLGKRPILHEQLLYVMFQLAAEECRPDSGRTPPFVELTYLGLLLNDHLDRGYSDAAEERAKFASSIALALRFNHDRDRLRAIARAYAILTDPPPPHVQLASVPDMWDEIQRAAFSGRTLDEYFGLFVHPMILFSQTLWGEKDAPILDPVQWYQNSPALQQLAQEWLLPLTVTREELAASAGAEPLPTMPTLLLRKPFVRFDDRYWAATPWACNRQLHTGIRHRLLDASKRLGKAHEEAWKFGFGEMVEAWTHKLAASAQQARHFRGRFIIPSRSGTGEVEDVVWTDDNVAILFSVKSSLMREDEGFNISSDSGVVDWLERFLFAPKSKTHRGGAARQLHANIERLRSGVTALPKDVVVFPVVVMYDDPLENVAIIDWVAERIHHHGLLGQHGVRPLLVCSIDTFEAVMFLASQGRHLGDLFESKQSPESRRIRFDVFLHERSTEDFFRLPLIEERFEKASSRSLAMLRDEAKIPTK